MPLDAAAGAAAGAAGAAVAGVPLLLLLPLLPLLFDCPQDPFGPARPVWAWKTKRTLSHFLQWLQ